MKRFRATYCTITDYYFTPKALVLYNSLAALVPADAFDLFVLCLDNKAERVVADLGLANVHAVTLDQVPDLKQITARPLFEFACAAKPFLLEFLLIHKELSKVFYFDSDMWFVSDPSFLIKHLDNYNIILKPAITESDSLEKDWGGLAHNSKYSGYYNGGFVGVHHHALPFVRWWKRMCAVSTSHDFRAYTVGDQRYLDYVPGCFEKVLLLRHKGCNFKHWMIRYAEVRRVDGKLFIGDEPVIFFHFSQSLGNITEYDPVFHPELRAYTMALREARLQLKVPFFGSQGRQLGVLTEKAESSRMNPWRSCVAYFTSRVKLLLPDALVSGRLRMSLKMTWLTWTANYYVSRGEGQALIAQMSMSQQVGPRTLQLIYRYALKGSGATVALGAIDGIPAICSLLARRQAITIDSFDARYFPEGKVFVNPKIAAFQANLAVLGLSERAMLLRQDPADDCQSKTTFPISLLTVDSTFGAQLITQYLVVWSKRLVDGGYVICLLPEAYDAQLLVGLDAEILNRLGGCLIRENPQDERHLIYRVNAHGTQMSGQIGNGIETSVGRLRQQECGRTLISGNTNRGLTGRGPSCQR